jgi:transposase
MFFEKSGLRVFVYKSEIDMRCGFERLHSYCVHQMGAVIDQGHVYLFFGKNRRRVKVLFYDGTGLVLIAKRIEGGRFMSLSGLLGRTEIKLTELKQIMHGSVIRTPVVDRSLEASTRRESFDLPQGMHQSI